MSVWYKKSQKLKMTQFSNPTKFTYQQRNGVIFLPLFACLSNCKNTATMKTPKIQHLKKIINGVSYRKQL